MWLMLAVAKRVLFFIICAFLNHSPASYAQHDLSAELRERLRFWRDIAYRCDGPSGLPFPSGERIPGELGCEDGDMVLFAGLLCAVGEREGCETVRRSQRLAVGDDYGRWYRSPRRMEIHNDVDGDGRTDEYEDENKDEDGDGRKGEREWNTFSHDMSLGVMLYLATETRSGGTSAEQAKTVGQSWWDWINRYTLCMLTGLGSHCIKRGLPRFCWNPPPEVKLVVGPCDLRPAPIGNDYAMLAEVGSFVGLNAPNGPFRGGLGTDSGKAVGTILRNARLNDEGFSEHIVAVELFLMRFIGQQHPDLTAAAALLNCEKPSIAERFVLDPTTCKPKTPENAFFLYLRDGPTDAVKQAVLNRCPAPDRLPERKSDWIWQRNECEPTWKVGTPWKHSMLWGLYLHGAPIRRKLSIALRTRRYAASPTTEQLGLRGLWAGHKAMEDLESCSPGTTACAASPTPCPPKTPKRAQLGVSS